MHLFGNPIIQREALSHHNFIFLGALRFPFERLKGRCLHLTAGERSF